MSDIITQCENILRFCKIDENRELLITNRTEYVQMMCKKYNTFFERYPTLFYKMIENPINFNMERLCHMLNMKAKIDNNNISHEDASKKIGAKYYNEFVKPFVKDE